MNLAKRATQCDGSCEIPPTYTAGKLSNLHRCPICYALPRSLIGNQAIVNVSSLYELFFKLISLNLLTHMCHPVSNWWESPKRVQPALQADSHSTVGVASPNLIYTAAKIKTCKKVISCLPWLYWVRLGKIVYRIQGSFIKKKQVIIICFFMFIEFL